MGRVHLPSFFLSSSAPTSKTTMKYSVTRCRESRFCWCAPRWSTRRSPTRGVLFWKKTGNHGPGANPALEIAFRQQLGVGIQDREPRPPQFSRQQSGGRNSLPWAEAARNDRGAVCIIDLSMQSFRSLAVDRDHGNNSGGCSVHGCGA